MCVYCVCLDCSLGSVMGSLKGTWAGSVCNAVAGLLQWRGGCCLWTALTVHQHHRSWFLCLRAFNIVLHPLHDSLRLTVNLSSCSWCPSDYWTLRAYWGRIQVPTVCTMESTWRAWEGCKLVFLQSVAELRKNEQEECLCQPHSFTTSAFALALVPKDTADC